MHKIRAVVRICIFLNHITAADDATSELMQQKIDRYKNLYGLDLFFGGDLDVLLAQHRSRLGDVVHPQD